MKKLFTTLTLLASIANAQTSCPLQQVCCQPTCEPKVVYRTKTVTKEVIVEKEVNKNKKNSLSLVGGASPSKLNVSQTSNHYDAKIEYQPDLGLMYQRDLEDDYRLSGALTIQGNILIGLGYNF